MTLRDLRNIDNTGVSCRDTLPCVTWHWNNPSIFICWWRSLLVATSKFGLLTIRWHSALRKHLFLYPKVDSWALRKPTKDKHPSFKFSIDSCNVNISAEWKMMHTYIGRWKSSGSKQQEKQVTLSKYIAKFFDFLTLKWTLVVELSTVLTNILKTLNFHLTQFLHAKHLFGLDTEKNGRKLSTEVIGTHGVQKQYQHVYGSHFLSGG